MSIRPAAILLATLGLGLASPALGQTGPRLTEEWLDGFQWRSIGPANMSGRVTDIEGLPSPSKTFYVAAAAGGIWKTTNNGIDLPASLPGRTRRIHGGPGHRPERQHADLGGHG